MISIKNSAFALVFFASSERTSALGSTLSTSSKKFSPVPSPSTKLWPLKPMQQRQAAVLPVLALAGDFSWSSIGLIGLVLLGLLAYLLLLLFTAGFTLVERKIMALFQRREGPDRLGPEGLGQPFADALKLLRKETLAPKHSPEERLFLVASLISLAVALGLWTLVPLGASGALSATAVSLLLLLGLSSLATYGVVFAGWSANSKYAFMGSLRSVAQLVSYEILLSLALLTLVTWASDLDLGGLAQSQQGHGMQLCAPLLFSVFFLVCLAEANRTPFDLPEAEAELVSGYNVEHSSMLFAFFFLAEYSGMGLLSVLGSVAFAGGAMPALGFWAALTLGAKVMFLCTIFVLVRAALPRVRFDHLVSLCWKYLFPALLLFVLGAVAQATGFLGAPEVQENLFASYGSFTILLGRSAFFTVAPVQRIFVHFYKKLKQCLNWTLSPFCLYFSRL